MKYEKGSEWRKWDLHVHTPESEGFTGDWEQFKEQLKQADCDVIGINDYFSVAGYKTVQNEIATGTLDIGEKFILPVVEMRMTDSVQNKKNNTKGVTHFNFHIIFNPELSTDDIENFIKSLKSEGTTISSDYGDKKKLKSKKVSFSDVLSSLNDNSRFKNKFLIWLPYDEYGGIDEIDPNSDAWIKDEFIRKSDILGSSNKKQIDFFLWNSQLKPDGTPKFTAQKFEQLLKQRKPCIKGSDSHKHNYPVGKLQDKDSNPVEKFCWIKADPTFEGLKQIIYEPEERVFIGEKPPILSKVENNKTNYIKFLKIDQASANHSGDIWFKDISIPFNNELIAIIGNKGSGKSGIADILGLVGDTHTNKQHFSFLHRDKFLKGKLANKFTAKIIWESDGESDDIPLSADPKTENPESVRFIPQNYFEELTNELEISKFQHVLENIIFEYIPDREKLNKSSFEELESYKAENVNKAIQEQKNKIQNINKEIIDLEKKKHPDFLKSIKGFISKKKIEIGQQNRLLESLPKITNPNNDDKDSEQQSKIAQQNTELDALKDSLKEKEKSRETLTSEIEELKQFKKKVELQEQSVEEFLKSHTEEAKEYNLDINKILKIKVDFSSIEEKILNSEKELEKINLFIGTVESTKARSADSNNESIVYKIKLLTKQLKAETDKLTGEEKAYQQNEQRKKSINEKIQELTGVPENPSLESLSFYEKEEEFINDHLQLLLKEKRKSRVEKSLEIFKNKNEIIELYNSFKKSVDDKIAQSKDLLEYYDIKIDSSFYLNSNFYSDFLNFINQRKSGCFLGEEKGGNKIKSIVEDSGFSNENKIEILLTNIIDSLEENNAKISEQVNNDKLNSFYDYVFSLDYLKPKYELKLGGKVLGQLSPGERGALLLIFYFMIDKEEIPLVIDQPEDNLDNESVYNMLSKFIKQAKKKRQIVMVTHNPNLAVGADAEQIIHVCIDKTNKNEFSFVSGSIENPEINKSIVKILEGTKPAFDKRKLKYQGQ